ncbi:heterokaryon incompatibility protein 6, OR allele [Podospora fimiseda]|uniref:Heterokaryon incompatibility protein 6, OR allele n=1 Tax=Podospora fimiseda TaxID=252190 RepID=A0AAN7BHJ0_9PEZI|nr:heterokaryon incompatibility protein 6, OR allele [Podospora fimiseda]
MNNTTRIKLKALNSFQEFSYQKSHIDEKIPEFRLLELYPPLPSPPSSDSSDDTSSELICRIFVTPLSSPSKPFKALSYVWGDDTKTHRILVKRETSDKRSSLMKYHDTEGEREYLKIPVTHSLFTALHNLRSAHDFSSGEPMILWIDQICINQGDQIEKAHQVGLMGQIYSTASEVLVWLGPEENDSDKVMQAFREVGQTARDLNVESYFTKEKLQTYLNAMNNVDPETSEFTTEFQSKVIGKALEKFPPILKEMDKWFQRGWFGRAWTVQEFCLCKETLFVCGRESLVAELVQLSVMALQASCRAHTMHKFTEEIGITMEEMDELAVFDPPTNRLFHCRVRRQKFMKGVEGSTGDRLLALLRNLYAGRYVTTAKEHRDRIYSLLGLAVDAEALGIVPDYTGMRDDEVTARILTDAARVMITNGTSGRIDALCFSQFPKLAGIRDHLPTWVADWRSGLKLSYYEIHEAVDEHFFAACGERLKPEPVAVPDNNPKILGLRGFVVGTIEAATPGDAWTPTRYDASRFVQYMTELSGFIKQAVEKDKLNPQQAFHTPERREESWWRMPTADMFWTPEKDKHRADDTAKEYFQIYSKSMQLMVEAAEETDEAVKEEKIAWYTEKGTSGQLLWWQSMEYTEGKRPFLTDSGYLGMGPSECKEGDVVVVFCGGRIPFVLRPVEGDERRYQFIGEAFCDGIMDGEIMGRTESCDFFLV